MATQERDVNNQRRGERANSDADDKEPIAAAGIDREKLLERVRKLYAMSSETESSPHEAEIAMRRCQSLMARFGITEADLASSEFGISRIGRAFRSIPGYLGVLGSAVALLHDCICVRSDTIEFRGFSIDAEVASLTFDYLSEVMERSLKRHKQAGTVAPGRAASFDYRVGFALAVLRRAQSIDAERRAVQEKAAADSAGSATSLVTRKQQIVRDACMKGLVTRRAARVRYRNGAAHAAGSTDGANVSLDKQMENARPKAMRGTVS